MPASAITPTAGHLDVGDTWLIGVDVRDDKRGTLVDATVTVTVTTPSATTSAPVATREGLGLYVASYELTAVGRYTARVVVSGAVVSVVGFAVDAEAASGRPVLAVVKAYLGQTSVTDAVITEALAAETAAQAEVCRIPAAYSDDLAEALKRRVARNLALRGLPLAVLQGDAESGDTILPGRDPEVRRLEAPHRKMVVR